VRALEERQERILARLHQLQLKLRKMVGSVSRNVELPALHVSFCCSARY